MTMMEKLISAWRLVRAAPWWLQAPLALLLLLLLFLFLGNAGWLYVLSAVTLWSLAILGYLHETNHLGRRLPSVKPLVSVLDKMIAPRQGIFRRNLVPKASAPEATASFLDSTWLAATLKSRVPGQSRVCDQVARTLRIRLAMMRGTQPLAKFLFAGPPGTGKTFLAKQLALALQRPLLHLDMAQFSDAATVTQLFGAQKGSTGSDRHGVLTGGLRTTPNAIVLLDKIEKAHPAVHKKVLTALKEGFIMEASDGQRVSTVDSLFILTTSAASEELGQLADHNAQRPEDLAGAATSVLRKAGFAPEVLSRIDDIMVFPPLKGMDIARVVALEIEAIVHRFGLEISGQGIDVQLLFSLMEGRAAAKPPCPLRDLIRAIEKSIAPSLAAAKEAGVASVRIIPKGQGFVAVPERKVANNRAS